MILSSHRFQWGIVNCLLVILLILAGTWGRPLPVSAKDTELSLGLAEGMCVSRAQQQFAAGKLGKAIDVLENCIQKKKDPDQVHYYLHFLLGNYYATLARTDDAPHPDAAARATDSFRAAIRQNPGLGEAWLNLASCCYESGQFAQAADSFEKAWELADEKKAAYLYYASVCHFQGQAPDKALALFHRLMQHHPDQITLEWKQTLVNILFALERYKQALPHIEILAENLAFPKNKPWQEMLIHQYLQLHMTDKALQYARKLTRLDPVDSRWWKLISRIHLNENRLEKGLAALVIYGFLTPLTREETLLAADLYLSVDVPGKAAQRYQTLLNREHDPLVLERLTRALAMAHEPDRAIEWIDRGMARDKQIDPELLLMKARLLYMKQEWSGAARAFEKAARLSDQPGYAWLMAGYAAMNRHDTPFARKAFQQAETFPKQSKPARDALAAMDRQQQTERTTP